MQPGGIIMSPPKNMIKEILPILQMEKPKAQGVTSFH